MVPGNSKHIEAILAIATWLSLLNLTLPDHFSIPYHGGELPYPCPFGGHLTPASNPDTFIELAANFFLKNFLKLGQNELVGTTKVEICLKGFFFDTLHAKNFQLCLFLEIRTLVSWLKSTLLLIIKWFDTHFYMKTNCLQTNETQQ